MFFDPCMNIRHAPVIMVAMKNTPEHSAPLRTQSNVDKRARRAEAVAQKLARQAEARVRHHKTQMRNCLHAPNGIVHVEDYKKFARKMKSITAAGEKIKK